jgi:hypothetical protein
MGRRITASRVASANPAPFPATRSARMVSDRHGRRIRRGAHALRHRRAIAKLPEADYEIEAWPDGVAGTEIALGYLFSLYRFSRYRSQSAPKARLEPRPT